MIGVPGHTESWIDEHVYLHQHDDVVENDSKRRRMQEDRVAPWVVSLSLSQPWESCKHMEP